MADEGAWEVTDVALTAEAAKFGRRAHYRFHVRGINHLTDGEPFSWSVPGLENPRYDLSSIKVPELPAGVFAAVANTKGRD